jgi:uncharacterized protein YdeI (YjbR/CyaY-like superfamily)
MQITQLLDIHKAREWRAWLKAHHASAKEVWLAYYRASSGQPRVSYNDAVDEAICFGWIDSQMKTVDRERFAQRFTPRRPGSPISELNLARARRMARLGKMTAAGRKALALALKARPGQAHGKDLKAGALKIAPDILKAMKADAAVWKNFSKFPKAYQRIRIAWIEGGRGRPAIFAMRLRYFLKMTGQNKQYGMLKA